MDRGPDLLAELATWEMQKSLLNFVEIGVTKRFIAEVTTSIWPSEFIVVRRPFHSENTRVLLAFYMCNECYQKLPLTACISEHYLRCQKKYSSLYHTPQTHYLKCSDQFVLSYCTRRTHNKVAHDKPNQTVESCHDKLDQIVRLDLQAVHQRKFKVYVAIREINSDYMSHRSTILVNDIDSSTPV